MNDTGFTNDGLRPALWLRVTGIVGMVWYAFGLLQFVRAYTMETAVAIDAGAITTAHGAAIDSTPGMIWATFALASAAGLAGAFSIWRGSALSKLAFTLSLASVLVYYIWVYQISGTADDRPDIEAIIALIVCSITLGFYLLSRRLE